MSKFFKWLGFKPEDIDFLQDSGHLGYGSYACDGQAAQDVQWPDADLIRERVEGQEADPRALRNTKRDELLNQLRSMQQLGEQNDKFKQALQIGITLVIRSAEAEQDINTEKSEEYLNKVERLVEGLNKITA